MRKLLFPATNVKLFSLPATKVDALNDLGIVELGNTPVCNSF